MVIHKFMRFFPGSKVKQMFEWLIVLQFVIFDSVEKMIKIFLLDKEMDDAGNR